MGQEPPGRTGRERKRRIAVVLFIVSAVLLVGGGLLLGISFYTLPPANTTSSANFPQIPTPSSARTTYKSSTFGYTIVYPTDWKLKTYEFQGTNYVQASYQVNAGDAYPFEVDCYANSKQLDAQTLWKQENANNPGQTPIGYITLKSRIVAFLSVGHGQQLNTLYTLVHKQVACDFNQFGSDRPITTIIYAVINSFQWK